jgi:CRISPR-associated exonuclease Cas4
MMEIGVNDDSGPVSGALTGDPINLSALNQYGYCPRRCGLIYLESEFEQNIHTARGNAEHERVDRAAHVTGHEGARVEYALPVWSERWGLIGKCDVVEFWPDGIIYPVEYKHGPKKQRLNDDLQIAAQALCLEEMFGRTILKGAIYHASSRRRREIIFTDELRQSVDRVAHAIRAMLASARLPPPINDRRCDECSLKSICAPAITAARARHQAVIQSLFEPDDSD